MGIRDKITRQMKRAKPSTTTTPPPAPAPPPAPVPEVGRYTTDGARIVAPDGRTFVPAGVNVGGTTAANGGGWPDFALSTEYAANMREFGANTVRVIVYATTRYPWSVGGKAAAAGKTVEQIAAEVDAVADALVSFWRAAGFVVILDVHDLTDWTPTPAHVDAVVAFWARNAAKWAGDSAVWFNVANEPALNQADWTALHRRALAAIRGAGATNIVVADLLTWASDCGRDWNGATVPFGWETPMIPALRAEFGHVVAGMHSYGGFGKWVDDAGLWRHFTAYRDAGVPLLIGETGYPYAPGVDGNTDTRREEMRSAALATFRTAPAFNVGVLWWASNFRDAFRLYTPTSDAIINEFAPGVEWNEGGQAFAAYVRSVTATGA